MTDLSLFDVDLSDLTGDVGPLARQTDPATSHAAAESLPREVLGEQRRRTLEMVVEVDRCNGHRGATAWEVVSRWSYTNTKPPMQNVVARRLTDLEHLGYVARTDDTRPGSSAREQVVWAPTGKAAA